MDEERGVPGGADAGESEAEFVAEVEKAFRRLRERPLVLSPADTRQAIEWYEDGIPLDVVRGVLDDLFRRASERPRQRPRSLGYCDDAVRDGWRQARELRAGRREPGASALPVDRAGAFRKAAAAVAASPAPEAARDEAAAALRALAEGRVPPDAADPVLAIEERIVEACRDELDETSRREVRGGAEREIAPYAAAMSPEVRERALRRAEAKRIRERFRLPDFSLLPPP